jgi:hypothetical protein
MMTAIARSSTLPRITNSLNSFSMGTLYLSAPGRRSPGIG